jgi:hypothetical protein
LRIPFFNRGNPCEEDEIRGLATDVYGEQLQRIRVKDFRSVKAFIFQQPGLKTVALIGDWTAGLGDPSDRAEVRKPLTAEQVQANAATYLEQFYRIVDPQQTEVRWQSECS